MLNEFFKIINQIIVGKLNNKILRMKRMRLYQ